MDFNDKYEWYISKMHNISKKTLIPYVYNSSSFSLNHLLKYSSHLWSRRFHTVSLALFFRVLTLIIFFDNFFFEYWQIRLTWHYLCWCLYADWLLFNDLTPSFSKPCCEMLFVLPSFSPTLRIFIQSKLWKLTKMSFIAIYKHKQSL
jgi:hypothetical protein